MDRIMLIVVHYVYSEDIGSLQPDKQTFYTKNFQSQMGITKTGLFCHLHSCYNPRMI